eukprot:6383353-Lingulodinium_polyedra.AAC.1
MPSELRPEGASSPWPVLTGGAQRLASQSCGSQGSSGLQQGRSAFPEAHVHPVACTAAGRPPRVHVRTAPLS